MNGAVSRSKSQQFSLVSCRYLARAAIFVNNARIVDAENVRNLTYRLDLNGNADLTTEEFVQARLGVALPRLRRRRQAHIKENDNIDRIFLGAVALDEIPWFCTPCFV